MKIPEIVQSSRDREYKQYSSRIIAAVVYEYLFNGLSHRALDETILHLDKNYSRGFHAMSILHYLGLNDEFKGIFANSSVGGAIFQLEKQGEHKYQMLIDLLRPYQYVGLQHFSWSVVNPILAKKKMDKTVYDNETGVPKAMTSFFNGDTLLNGERRNITLLLEESVFQAYVAKDNSKSSRVTLRWTSSMTKSMTLQCKALDEKFPVLAFEYEDADTYRVSVHPDKVPQNTSITVKPLIKSKPKEGVKKAQRRTKKVDYVDKAKKDKELGLLGEQEVLAYEKEKFIRSGQPDLAERIEHVSETQGDGLGYDILSFDANGNEMYIEVKTTRSKYQDQFFISQNEKEFAQKHPDSFRLYRLYDFEKKKKLVIYQYSDLVNMEFVPMQYFVKAK